MYNFGMWSYQRSCLYTPSNFSTPRVTYLFAEENSTLACIWRQSCQPMISFNVKSDKNFTNPWRDLYAIRLQKITFNGRLKGDHDDPLPMKK